MPILLPPLRISQISKNWPTVNNFWILQRLCSFWILQKVLNRLVDEGMQHWSKVVPLDIVDPVIVKSKTRTNYAH